MTFIDIAGLVTALGTATYGVVEGERAASAQKTAMRRQQTSQQQALAQAARQQKLAQEQAALASRRTPNPDQILASEYELGRRSGGSTLLTQGQREEERRANGPSLLGQ